MEVYSRGQGVGWGRSGVQRLELPKEALISGSLPYLCSELLKNKVILKVALLGRPREMNYSHHDCIPLIACFKTVL